MLHPPYVELAVTAVGKVMIKTLALRVGLRSFSGREQYNHGAIVGKVGQIGVSFHGFGDFSPRLAIIIPATGSYLCRGNEPETTT